MKEVLKMKVINTEIIRSFFTLPDFMLNSYLEDMSDTELVETRIANVNLWNWQFGHLLFGEHHHMKELKIVDPPVFPNGFIELYTPDGVDSEKSKFFCKAELFRIKKDVRNFTLTVLDSLTVEQLCSPTPESLKYLGPNVLSVFASEVGHWMHHIGQLALIRKSLGKKTY